MSNLLKISDAASIALHAMVMLADSQSEFLSVHDIAQKHGISQHHLAKIGQRLVKAELVESHRGPGGGFKLSKSPEQINLLEIFEAIEGPFKFGGCLLGNPACDRKECIYGGLIESVNKEFYEYFAETTLAKFINSNRKVKKDGNKKNSQDR